MENGRVKGLPEVEAFPETERFPVLFGEGEKPLLSWREEVKVFSQEEGLGGISMQKLGTRSFPPLKSCTSLTLPSKLATRSGKFKEKKFID
jgi:hypothetical protein